MDSVQAKLWAIQFKREKRLDEISRENPINPMFDLYREIEVPTLITSEDFHTISGEFETGEE